MSPPWGTLQERIAGTEATVANHDTAIDALRSQATATGATLSAATGAIGTLQGQVANVAGDVTAQGGAIGNLQVQLAANVVTLADLDTRVTANTTQIANIDGRVTVNTTQIADIDGRVTANTTQIANIDARVTTNTTRIAANDARDDVQDGRIGTLERRADGNDVRDDGQDAALAANNWRDDAQDGRIAGNTAAIGTLRSDVDAGRVGLVRQANPAGPVTVAAASGGDSVSFVGTGGDRRLSGVANGIAANDAATMGQLVSQANATLTSANAYTDRAVGAIVDHTAQMIALNNVDLRKDIRAISSGTTAIAGLPQSFIPGEGMVGMSVGGTGGEMAVAVGVSKAFAGEHPVVVRGGLAFDTRRGDATYNAGVGIHF